MRSLGRFWWEIVQQWEQTRYLGARTVNGALVCESWWVRLERAAKYAILGSTHRPWFRLQSGMEISDTEATTLWNR